MTDALLLSDPRFFGHRSSGYHPERPERLEAARAAVERARSANGLPFTPIAPRPVTDEEVVRVHDPAFVKWLRKMRGEAGYIDADTYVGASSVEIAEHRVATPGCAAAPSAAT